VFRPLPIPADETQAQQSENPSEPGVRNGSLLLELAQELGEGIELIEESTQEAGYARAIQSRP